MVVANRKTRELDPKFWYLESWAGAARRELGDYRGALDERARTQYVPYWARAAVRGSLGEMDQAVALLQRALDTRESWMVSAQQMPELVPRANKDPRARGILNDVEAIQRAAGGQAASANATR